MTRWRLYSIQNQLNTEGTQFKGISIFGSKLYSAFVENSRYGIASIDLSFSKPTVDLFILPIDRNGVPNGIDMVMPSETNVFAAAGFESIDPVGETVKSSSLLSFDITTSVINRYDFPELSQVQYLQTDQSDFVLYCLKTDALKEVRILGSTVVDGVTSDG